MKFRINVIQSVAYDFPFEAASKSKAIKTVKDMLAGIYAQDDGPQANVVYEDINATEISDESPPARIDSLQFAMVDGVKRERMMALTTDQGTAMLETGLTMAEFGNPECRLKCEHLALKNPDCKELNWVEVTRNDAFYACQGCDGSGIRPDSTPHAGPPPEGFVCVERCDSCDKYANDLEAAKAWGDEAQWQQGNGTIQTIAKPRDPIHELCKHCDHFIEDNTLNCEAFTDLARYVHLEDGEQEFDHDATPSGQSRTLSEWGIKRPDLFIKHPDGKIGPNSKHHNQSGKVKS